MASAFRIGFVFTTDPRDPAALSGMPFAASRALAARGHSVVPLRVPIGPRQHGPWIRKVASFLPRRLRELPSRLASRRAGCVLDRAMTASTALSRELADARSTAPLDVLVGMCISMPLAFLATEVPIVYASDATARLVNSSYPRFVRRGSAYKLECDEVERLALLRASAVGLASEAALRSAHEDYGIPSWRLHHVPLGCHHVVDADEVVALPPPSREDVRLLLVASDAERKRVDFAVDVVALLRRRGIAARLLSIGPRTRATSASFVQSLGPLRLGDERDARIHRKAIASTHLCIQPSIGEAFGIAAAESAYAARPAVASAVGGLPTVIRDNETGVLLPPSARRGEWADAIAALIDEPDRYARMARAAQERARREFTWPRWAERIEAMCVAAVREGYERSNEPMRAA